MIRNHKRKEGLKKVDNISYITNYLITKEKLAKILDVAGLKYELGGIEPFENFWVADKKNKAILVVNINDVNENGESETEKEALKEFELAEAILPDNSHILDVEYADYAVLNKFEKALKSLYPESYYYDDERNEFIKL